VCWLDGEEERSSADEGLEIVVVIFWHHLVDDGQELRFPSSPFHERLCFFHKNTP
jgi:hypothetical protein